MRPFTSEQKSLIDKGDILTGQLERDIEMAFGVGDKPVYEAKRHYYITSGPGAGKTFTVLRTAEKHNVDMIKIQGAASLNAVMNSLAFVEYYTPREKQIVVWVDDCDSLFIDSGSLNVMKGVLDEERNVFSWNKNLSTQINALQSSEDQDQQRLGEALASFRLPGSVGVEVSTSRMRFIVTSNRQLIASNDPKMRGRPNQKLVDESAIRDRVNYIQLTQDPKLLWGWLASIVLKSDIQISRPQSHDLLLWMFDNWDRLSGNSMRTVKDLAAAMLNHPSNYIDYWESRYLIAR